MTNDEWLKSLEPAELKAWFAAERDEWKRKAEGRSAKRATAVERLKDARYHTLADYVRAMLGWGHEPHFEDCRDALIDLLTDDDDDDSKAQSKTEPILSEQSESLSDEGDTREKLEKDLKTHMYEFGGYCCSSREGHTDNVDTFFEDFVFLLDRQAAITRAEVNHDAGIAAHEAGKILREQIAELQVENAKLWRMNDNIGAELANFGEQRDKEIAERDEDAGRLQRENMQLARDLGECMAERDGYREKLGRAVDSAWEIVQLMDGDDGE